MQISVNEYNTVINGLKQQLELQRMMTREANAARDGVLLALRDEVERRKEQANAAKVLGDSVCEYADDLDRVLLAVRGDAAAEPRSLTATLIVSAAAEKQAEINALLENIDELHAQIAAMKKSKRTRK